MTAKADTLLMDPDPTGVVPGVPMPPNDEIVLIDLSSIGHPIWHVSQSDPDPNKASQQIVARVRALANNHRHVAICCDCGPSFRKEIAESYKANRPPAEAMLHHQIDLAKEQLLADGFPIWAVRGFEADDLIATAVTRATAAGRPALIVSADKDLLQLVGQNVRAMSARDGSIVDAAGVAAKFGVKPEQMRDYLSLVGDASDNIKGAKGIGEKKAAPLLAKFGGLDRLYEELASVGGAALGLPPALTQALREFQPALETTRALISLRTDVDIPFEQIDAERVPKEVASFGDFECDDDLQKPTGEPVRQGVTAGVDPAEGEVSDLPGNGAPHGDASSASRPTSPQTALAVREPDAVIDQQPAEWERQLDPRSMRDARVLAKDMHDSRLFSAYGTPQAVLSTVMLGRELGLPAMASLRGVHIIEGRHALSAQTMVALVLKSGLADYFRPVSFSATEATYETLRKGPGNQPIRLSHTIEMAAQAGLVKDKSGWQKNPTDMLVARASSRLARMVYPDIVGGLYTPEELAEIREQVA